MKHQTVVSTDIAPAPKKEKGIILTFTTDSGEVVSYRFIKYELRMLMMRVLRLLGPGRGEGDEEKGFVERMR